MPKDIGPAGFERTVGENKIMERSGSYSGYQRHGSPHIMELAKKIAEDLALHEVDIQNQPTIVDKVDTVATEAGYKHLDEVYKNG